MIAGPGDAKVKEGDTLVRFTGAKALDTEISTLDKTSSQRVKTELFKAQQERDAAIASGNKTAQATAEAKVADRQKSLDDKQGKLATKKSDRDKLEIKSPGDRHVHREGEGHAEGHADRRARHAAARADQDRHVQEGRRGSEVACPARHDGQQEALVRRHVRGCRRRCDRVSRRCRRRTAPRSRSVASTRRRRPTPARHRTVLLQARPPVPHRRCRRLPRHALQPRRVRRPRVRHPRVRHSPSRPSTNLPTSLQPTRHPPIPPPAPPARQCSRG